MHSAASARSSSSPSEFTRRAAHHSTISHMAAAFARATSGRCWTTCAHFAKICSCTQLPPNQYDNAQRCTHGAVRRVCADLARMHMRCSTAALGDSRVVGRQKLAQTRQHSEVLFVLQRQQLRTCARITPLEPLHQLLCCSRVVCHGLGWEVCWTHEGRVDKAFTMAKMQLRIEWVLLGLSNCTVHKRGNGSALCALHGAAFFVCFGPAANQNRRKCRTSRPASI